MLKVNFYNCPDPEKFDTELMPKEIPEFLVYEPNFELVQSLKEKYSNFRKILVLGHGGSVSALEAIWGDREKNITVLSTVDPHRVKLLKKDFSSEDTLVIPISKSGTTITTIEMVLAFSGYTMLGITDKRSALGKLLSKKGFDVFGHPEGIGGRFSGLTEVSMLPLALGGVDAKTVLRGGKSILAKFSEPNIAFDVASVFQQLEDKGYVDILWATYSSLLTAFHPLLTQLIHETYCKDEQGQSVLAFEGPELQHHTNQRLFGGRKNLALCVVSTAQHVMQVLEVGPDISEINYSDQTLGRLNGESLGNALEAERHGVIETAKNKKIPVIEIILEDISLGSVGEYLGFLMLSAYYGAILRDVEPLDQPAVEESKALGILARFSQK